MERTLVVVKPDGIQRALIGEIMQRYERTGLKLVGLKMLVPTEKMIEEHYLLDPNWKRLCNYLEYSELRLCPCPQSNISDWESPEHKAQSAHFSRRLNYRLQPILREHICPNQNKCDTRDSAVPKNEPLANPALLCLFPQTKVR